MHNYLPMMFLQIAMSLNSLLHVLLLSQRLRETETHSHKLARSMWMKALLCRASRKSLWRQPFMSSSSATWLLRDSACSFMSRTRPMASCPPISLSSQNSSSAPTEAPDAAVNTHHALHWNMKTSGNLSGC